MTHRKQQLTARPARKIYEPKMRPLLSRPGAAFRCFGDGLCCTDIHALGVLTRSEVKWLRQRDKLSVIYSDDVDGFCLKPIDSRCTFLDSQDRCGIHAQYGAAAKPAGCRRFPYGLVSTPYGGRVTTEHRCPCRTLGDRPEINLEDADRSLRDNGGRLDSDKDVPSRIEMRAGQSILFDRYLAIETDMIARLNAGEPAESVLAAQALPDLAESSWAVIAVEQVDMQDSSAGGEICAWFGDALLELATGHKPPARRRPWAWAYERATARPGGREQTAEYVYNDWIADEIWMFRWLDWDVSFDAARAEMATRLKVARLIQSRIEQENVLPAQAAAEAVMICELVSEGSEWPKAVANIATDPSPADVLKLPSRAS